MRLNLRLCAALLPLLLCAGVALAGAMDEEYSVIASTYLLQHFNGDMKALGQGNAATATPFGDAKLVDGGWKGGALEPGANGGLTIQTDKMYIPENGIVTI